MRLFKAETVYRIFQKPVTWYLKFRFNIEMGANEIGDKKGAFLVVGHHVSNFDPFFSNLAAGRLIRYLTADANMDDPLKNFFLKQLECIPFQKNKADMKAIRIMMGHIKKGHPVGLYPEGGRNWDGATGPLIPSTAKLIKMMGVPVYAAFYKGGHLIRPRFARKYNKGKIIIDHRLIFPAEEIKAMSSQDILLSLEKKLDYNEYDWQRQVQIPYKGRHKAEDIERSIYLCDQCGAVDSFTSMNNRFKCCECQADYSIDKYGFIQGHPRFEDVSQWSRWQADQISQVVFQGFQYESKGMYLVRLNPETKVKRRYFINFVLTKNILEIQFKDHTESLEIKKIYGYSMTFNHFLEFYYDHKKYRFLFDPKNHLSIKLTYDIIKHLKEARNDS